MRRPVSGVLMALCLGLGASASHAGEIVVDGFIELSGFDPPFTPSFFFLDFSGSVAATEAELAAGFTGLTGPLDAVTPAPFTVGGTALQAGDITARVTQPTDPTGRVIFAIGLDPVTSVAGNSDDFFVIFRSGPGERVGTTPLVLTEFVDATLANAGSAALADPAVGLGSITLTFIPEPTTGTLLAVSVGAMGWRRAGRRRAG